MELTSDMISTMAKAIADGNKHRAAYIAKIVKGEHAGKFIGLRFNPVKRPSACRLCSTEKRLFMMSAPLDMNNDESMIELICVRKGVE